VSARKLEIVVPSRIWERLERVEAKTGIRKTDLIMRAIIRVLEEFEGTS